MNARVEVDVIHPETDKFLLEVIVYGFSSPAAFIMDNLEYEAELCEDLHDNEGGEETTTVGKFA